jgi:metal-sulfur cluster biosynthetic enzyme
MTKVTEEQVWDALGRVYDPCCADRGISVVDMGVADAVRIDPDGVIHVDLVLTTGWCPFVSSMEDAIPDRLHEELGDVEVAVHAGWDTPWTMDRLAPSAREKLTMPLEQLLPYREARLAAMAAPSQSEVAV